MPAMNNDCVKKVVFYSTRQIHPYFSDENDLISCDSMIRYFSHLKGKNKETKDEFSEWLSALAFLHEYQLKIEEIRQKLMEEGCGDIQKKYPEVPSILSRINDDDPIAIYDDLSFCLYDYHKSSYAQEKKDFFWEAAYQKFIDLDNNSENNCFEKKHLEVFKDRVLSGKETHLNRDLTESKEEIDSTVKLESKSLLIHRLGIYHKEKDEYAVCAIWPWDGDMDPKHDEDWKNIIVSAIRELYPNCDEIILVIHNKDFKEWTKKDQIVFRKKPLSQISNSDNNEECLPNEADPPISLIVFQHTNSEVVGPLKKERENNLLFTPQRVWEAIEKYLKRHSLRKADNDNLIAKTHNGSNN